MITDYMIIRTTDAAEMAMQVRAGIAQGWQPYGELDIMQVAPYVTFTQPMAKYAEDVQIVGPEILGWPAPGVYAEPAGGKPTDHSQLLDAATFAMHALTDRQPGGVPNGEEALARLVAAIEGTELHAKWRSIGGE